MHTCALERDIKMSEIKWIKITTDIFDDEKIRLIDALPERDAILVIWFKILTLAGREGGNGLLMMNNRVHYTDEMLSTLFSRPLNTVRFALATFEKYGMIEIIDGIISLPNWEKHQNIEGIEKIKEQTRKRVARHRENQKKLLESNVTCNVTVTQGNATDIDKELERDKEEELKKHIGQVEDIVLPAWLDENALIEVQKSKPKNYASRIPIAYLNQKTGKSFKFVEKNVNFVKSRLKEGYTLEDFKQVIDLKVSQWLHDANMSKYLRPETLFGTKFEGYLNERPMKQAQVLPDNDIGI